MLHMLQEVVGPLGGTSGFGGDSRCLRDCRHSPLCVFRAVLLPGRVTPEKSFKGGPSCTLNCSPTPHKLTLAAGRVLPHYHPGVVHPGLYLFPRVAFSHPTPIGRKENWPCALENGNQRKPTNCLPFCLDHLCEARGRGKCSHK